MARKQRTLEKMCDERYEDDEVRQAIYDDAIRLGHREKIESGELRLPDEEHAQKWHEATTGRTEAVKEQQAQQARIAELEKQVAALNASLAEPKPDYQKMVDDRIQALMGENK